MCQNTFIALCLDKTTSRKLPTEWFSMSGYPKGKFDAICIDLFVSIVILHLDLLLPNCQLVLEGCHRESPSRPAPQLNLAAA